MPAETVLVLVHAAATWFMVGLIWFVQIVHYPLFERVIGDGWVAYGERHRIATTLVVMPVMLVELAAAAALVAVRPGWETWAGLGLLGVVWLSTFLVQVPLHGRLGQSHDLAVIRRLVRTNWVRTAAWSVRGGLALLLLA